MERATMISMRITAWVGLRRDRIKIKIKKGRWVTSSGRTLVYTTMTPQPAKKERR